MDFFFGQRVWRHRREHSSNPRYRRRIRQSGGKCHHQIQVCRVFGRENGVASRRRGRCRDQGESNYARARK